MLDDRELVKVFVEADMIVPINIHVSFEFFNEF